MMDDDGWQSKPTVGPKGGGQALSPLLTICQVQLSIYWRVKFRKYPKLIAPRICLRRLERQKSGLASTKIVFGRLLKHIDIDNSGMYGHVWNIPRSPKGFIVKWVKRV